MLNLFCGNEDCRWHTEKRGGTFHFRDGRMFCQDCYHLRPVLNDGKNLWDFETTHIRRDGKKVRISGIADLRRLEKEHGVVSVAANTEERLWNEVQRR
jgi:hypothetical protein